MAWQSIIFPIHLTLAFTIFFSPRLFEAFKDGIVAFFGCSSLCKKWNKFQGKTYSDKHFIVYSRLFVILMLAIFENYFLILHNFEHNFLYGNTWSISSSKF